MLPAHRPVVAHPFSDPALRHELAGPLLRTFRAIADEWGLTTEQRVALLGSPPRSTFFHWQQTASRGGAPSTLSADHIARLSLVANIFATLEQWLGHVPEAARAWVTRPNDAPRYGGRPPIDVMIIEGIVGLTDTERYVTQAVGSPNLTTQAYGAAQQAARERASAEAGPPIEYATSLGMASRGVKKSSFAKAARRGDGRRGG